MIRKNVVSVIMLIAIALTIIIRWLGLSGENYRSIITSDGRGYYQYYEASLGEKSISDQTSNGTYLVITPDSSVVNKYFVGLPVLWSPFVLPVYVYYKIFNTASIDFYSEGFQKAISLAALFYLFLGLIAMKRLLQSFDIEKKIINFTLFAFFFGTNLSYYSIIAPSMSHVYSFSLIAGFLYFSRQYSIRSLPRDYIYSALLFGLLVLVRPVNGLILFIIPIIWKRNKAVLDILKSNIKLLFIGFFLILMILALQPLFWFLQTGSFIQWSYAGEGFYFAHPQVLNFIFSFRKGFLVYSPILVFSLLAIFMVYRQNKWRARWAFGFVFLLIYVLSSWWNWYYGDSYGSRALIDFYSVFILLFALGMQFLQNKTRVIIASLSLLFISLNLFQSYQYYHNIMSHYDMNAEKYAYIFLKGGAEYEHCLGGNNDIAPYHKKPMKLVFEINNKKASPHYRISCDQSIGSYSSNEEIKTMVQGKLFPCTISISTNGLNKYKSLYVEMNCEYTSSQKLDGVFWTTSIHSSVAPSHYYAFRVNATPEFAANSRSDYYRFTIPIPKNTTEDILISLWNKTKKNFGLHIVSIKIYGITE